MRVRIFNLFFQFLFVANGARHSPLPSDLWLTEGMIFSLQHEVGFFQLSADSQKDNNPLKNPSQSIYAATLELSESAIRFEIGSVLGM